MSATTFVDYAAQRARRSDLKARRRIEWALKRLYSLGFRADGYQELLDLYRETTSSFQRQLAAFHLGLWHANSRDAAQAEKALEFLSTVSSGGSDEPFFVDLVILKAECEVLIGENEAARHRLEQAVQKTSHPDLHFALANLLSRDAPHDLAKRINMGLAETGIPPIVLDPALERDLFECIVGVKDSARQTDREPLISIIVPAFNSARTLPTALESLQAQSWQNIEVLIVDDRSTDDTREIAAEFVRSDVRFRIIEAPCNGGPYVARNLALSQAHGYFVTCHDADDWSHPEKLRVQAQHLLDNPTVIANTSQQARAFSNLIFHRRENRGTYIFSNMSSLMFRREAVVERAGFWDSVRFGADSEFIKRLKLLFGRKAVVELGSGALCFQRQSDSSLTGHQAFGFHGYFYGARAEYRDASQEFFNSSVASLKYSFPQLARPFEVPDPLRPVRHAANGSARHFDIIIASEFRMRGGSTRSCIEEIKAHSRLGLKTGLVHLARYDLPPIRRIIPEIRDLLREGEVELITYGERVTCDLLIVRYPPGLYRHQVYVPEVEAKHIRVIVNQPPMSDYSANGVRRYFIADCQQNLERYFGSAARDAVWCPIGPLVRQALVAHHAEELGAIHLAEEDWANIIDVDEWDVRGSRSIACPPRIGRHARDDVVKWPSDKDTLLSVYPSSDKYAVRILGGASVPLRMLGDLPQSWTVWKFGELSPKEFLRDLDVFVYYTHPQWIESFGRVIIEAMAAGVPVVLPPEYKVMFGDAALYAPPGEALKLVDELICNPELYESQVDKGKVEVRAKYSYGLHANRIRPYLNVSVPTGCRNRTSVQPKRSDPLTLSLVSWDAKVLAREREQVAGGGCNHYAELMARLKDDADSALRRVSSSANLEAFSPRASCWGGGTIVSVLSKPIRALTPQLLEDVFVLALANWFGGVDEYAEHAVRMLQTFFVEDAHSDSQHLESIHSVAGEQEVARPEIVDYGAFCFFLDAVRLLEFFDKVPDGVRQKLRRWMGSYLDWLVASPQGKAECGKNNHLGTYYDLQLGAIAEYLGETDVVWEVIARLEERAFAQFNEQGIQVEELSMPRSAHCCCLNLQGWILLLEFAARWGVSPLETHRDVGARIRRGRAWLLAHAGYPWPYEQGQVLEEERLLPIALAESLGEENALDARIRLGCCKYQLRPVFPSQWGIRPYWNLGGRTGPLESCNESAPERVRGGLEFDCKLMI